MRRSLLALACLITVCCVRASDHAPQRAQESEVSVLGLRNIQRTMGMLARSTSSQRMPVRVLFYGQSITQSPWSRHVETALRRRYPNADLTIENRALGGFHAQLLVKAAESDLYAFQPDLVVFHVYGDHRRYEDIVRRLRERTTAEILLTTDHVTKSDELDEPSDSRTLTPEGGPFAAFMNHRFLPGLVPTYQTALCDVRGAWKQFLITRGLTPDALLSDEIHLNARGDALMATLVERCLREAPELGPSPAERWVETYLVGEQARFVGSTLHLRFEGSRIDVVTRAGASGTVDVRIDGKPPSDYPELTSFGRAHADEGGKWPPVYGLESKAPRLLETFRFDVERSADQPAVYRFSVTGDRGGFEGEGRTDQRFVARSRRLVIEPDDWNVDYAFQLAGHTPAPARFTVRVRVEPHFTDAFAAIPGDPSRERVLTLAQGLTSGPHELTLTGDGTHVAALRVHRPPGARERTFPSE